MSQLASTLEELKSGFLARHERKEDRFWAVKMGLADDAARAQRELAEAEIAHNEFLQDPERLQRLRALEAAAERFARWVDGQARMAP